MVSILSGFKGIVPFDSTNRIINILLIVSYVMIGAGVYLIIMFKSKLIYQIFGRDNIKKVTNKFKK